jgi:hypothetical protein
MMRVQSKAVRWSLTCLTLALLVLIANSETTTTVVAPTSSTDEPAFLGPDFPAISRQTKEENKKSDDDYFYDENLDQAAIDELQKKRKLEEKERLKSLTTTTEAPPEWFDKKEDNPMMSYMKQACQEYVKKHFEEMSKSKTKSTLNHSMLSVVTLTGFFSMGIFIGLLIVLVKGRTFKKNAKSLVGGKASDGKLEPKKQKKKQPADGDVVEKKAAYTSVQQSEQIV